MGLAGHRTVSPGLRETVAKRNVPRVFQILFIETVRAPPLRATETAVSVKKRTKNAHTHKKKTKKNAQRRAKPIETVRALLSPAFS